MDTEDDDLVEEDAYLHRGAKRTKTEDTKRLIPEVANGINIVLRWETKKHAWVPYDNMGAKYTKKDGWHILLPHPPLRSGSGADTDVPIYQSWAAKSINMSKLRMRLYENLENRDEQNTQVGLTTQLAPNLGSSGQGSSSSAYLMPQTHAGMSSLSGAPGEMFQPLEARLADHLDAAIGLTQLTKTIRTLEDNRPTRIDKQGHVTEPGHEEKNYVEHLVDAGRVAREITYRRAPEDFVRILDILMNDILFAYSVMPQV